MAANYGRLKSTKIAPIGTIMPWGGGSRVGERADNVPKGWIVCDLQAQLLNAADYPLLAKIIGNTYGPFPEATDTTSIIGVNFGIVNDFPYNPPQGVLHHDPAKHVDQFALPNLNQLALVDIEASRMPTDALLELGNLISKNGIEGDLPETLVEASVDITFDVEQSDNLAGRITGITMDDPIYFDTVYVVPRKLGLDHIAQHTHRPLDEDTPFTSVIATGQPVQEWDPPTPRPANPVSSVDLTGNRGSDSPAHSFTQGDGERDITWYDPDDGGISAPLLDSAIQIGLANTKVPLPPPSGSRNIPSNSKIETGYQDDYSAVVNVQADALTGTFPPAGRYNGKRNFYPSPDIPDYHRGAQMPSSYVSDPIYDVAAGDKQPINLAVNNTYATTLNHAFDRWLDSGLRSHTHDAMEVTMSRGSLSIPTNVLVNNVSTGTTIPLSVDTALNITMNPNTPSLTMMYIIRAF